MDNLLEVFLHRFKNQSLEFFAQFTHSPDMTYEQLDGLAGCIGQQFTANRLNKSDRLIVIGDNSPEMLATITAAWFYGIIVCPISPKTKKTRFEAIINLFQPDMVIALENMSLITEYKKQTSFIILGQADIDSSSKGHLISNCNQVAKINNSDGCTCIYTSGSTGTPKGVLLSFENIKIGADNLISALSITPSSKACCVLPVSHINGLITTFVSIVVSGGNVVYLQDSTTAENIADTIDKYSCTWLSAVPYHYTALVNPIVPRFIDKMASLKLCRSASAPLPKVVMEQFENAYSIPIVETMGMSEASGQIFSNPITSGKQVCNSVGMPFGFEVKVVDETGKKLGPNQIGEIYVKGDALMLGYIDDQSETVKAYDGDFLKSGDLGFYDQDGYYFLTGRAKDIAIFSGENISLRELEESILDQFEILDVAAVATADKRFGESILLYLVLKNDATNVSDLCTNIGQVLSELLPNVAAIAGFRIVSSLPRSPVGKILKGELINPSIPFQAVSPNFATAIDLLSWLMQIPSSEIDVATHRKSFSKWDSLTHTALVAHVEAQIGRELSGVEIVSIQNISDVDKLLSGKTITLVNDPKEQQQKVADYLRSLEELGLLAHEYVYLLLSEHSCHSRGVYDVALLIETILGRISPDQTLILNTFSWNFCKTKQYKKLTDKCQVGLINEIFRKHPLVLQSSHPLYSYAVFGEKSGVLTNHNSESCWGVGSVAEKIANLKDCVVISDGVKKLHGNPTIHVLEEAFEVPYREFKWFEGRVDFGEGLTDFRTKMFVRSYTDEHVNNWQPIIDELESTNAVKGDFVDNGMYSYMNSHLVNIATNLLNENPRSLAVRKADL